MTQSQTHSDCIASLARSLVDHIAAIDYPVVAFSGGVDSSVVAAAAFAARPDQAIAITSSSPALASWQLAIATRVASEIGIRHQVIQTDEIHRQAYRRNDSQRCFFCKDTLYSALDHIVASSKHTGASTGVLSGTNADDLGDYRPGLRAGRDHRIRTPLADLGISKQRVRVLAKYFGLSVHDLPASPCLASRIAYGIEVTPRRLAAIDRCESWLRCRGFLEVRVRCLRINEAETASVEVPTDDMPRLGSIKEPMTRYFLQFHFDRVVIDPEGFRSGKLNDALVTMGTTRRGANTR